ncbi:MULTISPECIES: type IV pilin protein [Xanthomonas]|uniref:Pilus assembly protein PilE n=2 Tax=Xanthomonas citri TaxID=346 RepID=A0AB33CCB7_XANCI|nr:type IV pilin protein [Xanthomonas citri]MBV6780854.1 type IV pilin protein [Xanthomonas campestris pv. trichodesmae]AMV00840.1 pilus assembly protein PilE [Xanthomonas citri pv. aurantifolii]AMV04291.1 pilus assembly protein PilE [Xanthomonas citri pv. aurantifolii]AMV08923.1 pilus assembly protein PilE [Xanthomonas citri pv. aurantifolii]ARE57318.1 pilus assembly protein PilE [Xanthomonas citri pv. aurantifolii]
MKRAAAHVRGFTLIELMIVVAVVAILSAIAYPSYTEHVRKSRRAQAKVDLVEYGQLAERFHTVQNTYSGFTLPTNVSPREGGTAAYTLALTQQTQSGYVITATPAAAQAADKCGTLSIDQASRKTNSRGTKSDCW